MLNDAHHYNINKSSQRKKLRVQAISRGHRAFPASQISQGMWGKSLARKATTLHPPLPRSLAKPGWRRRPAEQVFFSVSGLAEENSAGRLYDACLVSQAELLWMCALVALRLSLVFF